MAYLTLQDYQTYIQGSYLIALTQGNDSKRQTEENVSIQAIAQRLTQKYDLNSEFTSMLPWKSTKIYQVGERCTVDLDPNGFMPWVSMQAYVAGSAVIQAGIGYYCTTPNSDTVFTPSKWSSVGAQYSIYYGAYPTTCTVNGQPNPPSLMQPYAPVFNYKTIYAQGDIAFWKGYTYVCAQASMCITHFATLQYAEYSNIPYSNVFPDDPVNNNAGQYWSNKTAFVVAAGTLLTNPAWIAGDNRNQTIKDAMVRITTFKLSPLIAGKNVPAVWLDDYRSILREMNEAAEGKITLMLPLKQPNNATRTYYGGRTKEITYY